MDRASIFEKEKKNNSVFSQGNIKILTNMKKKLKILKQISFWKHFPKRMLIVRPKIPQIPQDLFERSA